VPYRSKLREFLDSNSEALEQLVLGMYTLRVFEEGRGGGHSELGYREADGLPNVG
jgi:hypothetical protein